MRTTRRTEVLTKDVPSGIYNMGDDEALSTNELIEEICKSLGKKAHKRADEWCGENRWLVASAAESGEVEETDGELHQFE